MKNYILWWIRFYYKPEISYRLVCKKDLLSILIIFFIALLLIAFQYLLLYFILDKNFLFYDKNFENLSIFMSILIFLSLLYHIFIAINSVCLKHMIIKIVLQKIKFTIFISPILILLYLISKIFGLDIWILYFEIFIFLLFFVKLVFMPIHQYIVNCKFY